MCAEHLQKLNSNLVDFYLLWCYNQAYGKKEQLYERRT